MNYKGFFKSLDGDLYEVRLISDSASTAYTEILMAGTQPFVLNVSSPSTMYEPLKTGVASINIVHNTYLEDCLPQYAQETKVVLYKNNVPEWTGWLTPKIYNQQYVNEYETIELDANDCITTLQYIDYTDSTAYTKSFKTFKELIDRICTEAGLDGYYWPRCKKIDNNFLSPSMLKISEYNFFSSDTDEPWNLQEVLEEICRYLGLVCLQYKTYMYFVDYDYLNSANMELMQFYPKYSSYVPTQMISIGSLKTLTQDNIRGTGAQISFKPIYTKFAINDNFYSCDEFIPQPFDDKLLTNRNGNIYSYHMIPCYTNPNDPNDHFPRYRNGTSWGSQYWSIDNQDSDENPNGDATYYYYQRLYDNKYWESVYRTKTGPTASTVTTLTEQELKSTACTANYIGGTIVDLGVVKRPYWSDYDQVIVPSKVDFTRYLLINQQNCGNINYYNTGETIQSTVFRLKPGFSSTCVLPSNCFLCINFDVTWEKYQNLPYINPDWVTTPPKVKNGIQQLAGDGYITCKLRIGNKWFTDSHTWSTTEQSFRIFQEKKSSETGTWNEAQTVLNTVSYQSWSGEEGFSIPLAGTDMTQGVGFEIILPRLQRHYLTSSFEDDCNGICWLSNISIRVGKYEQLFKDMVEADVVYETETTGDTVNELDEITLRITTSSNLAKPSYSNVIYDNALLEGIADYGKVQKVPEQNLLERYENQYSTQTSEISTVLDLGISPMDIVKGIDVSHPNDKYIITGFDIDYQYARQEIKLEQKK